jgi:imidazolonepropionase-like amidohydrolase
MYILIYSTPSKRLQMNRINVLFLFLFGISGVQSQSIDFSTSNRLIFGTYEERTASIGIGDVDNDGDMDVVIANGRHWPGQNRIFFNNGSGKFSVSKALGIESSTSYSTELADFDNDGDLDIAVGNDMAPNNLFINDGEGNFTKTGTFGERYAPTRNIIVADIDDDGDSDILITNRGRENEICLNDGNGNFTESLGFGTKDDSTIDVEVADMDNDGDNDLVLANRDKQQNYVYLNNGNTHFSKKIPYGNGVDNTRSVAISDFDNDGFWDIAVANVGESNKIYFGDQELAFSRSVEFESFAGESSSITVADFNLDGNDDIAIGNFKQPNAIFINQNDGSSWEKIQLSNKESFTYDIYAKDIDNDGKPDIVESNSDELNRYYFNKYEDPALKNIDSKGDFLIYRRQSLIGEERFNIINSTDSLIVESLQGENERGRISGVKSVLHVDKKNFTPNYYHSYRIANGDTTNIFKMTRSDESVSILEKHFDVVTSNVDRGFFPLHSNIPAGIEAMLYQYFFKHHDLSTSLKTLPRGEIHISHKGQDLVQIKGKDIMLDRYVVDGINWGGRTVWLDEHKNLIALVKANTQIREIIKKGYEEAMLTFIAGNVEEQIAQLTSYTHNQKAKQAQITALVGGDVIDGIHDQTYKNQVLLIENGRIKAMGKRKDITIPPNAKVMDVSGKTLMPGLWDMHAHSNQVQWAPAYLAGGVTTIRDNGNEVEFATAFRDAIANDGMLGPDILLAGMTDGSGKKGNGIIRATTPQEAREVVNMYLNKGYKQIKIYNSIEPEVLKILAEEAHKRGVTVTGHIPNAVGTIHEAVSLGMNMFSHDRAITSLLFPETRKTEFSGLDIDYANIDEGRIKHATDFLLKHNITLDPTTNLIAVRTLERGTPLETIEPNADRIAYELWEGKRFRAGRSPAAAKVMKAKYKKYLEIIGHFFRAGVPIVAGTDNAVPVFCLYLELENYNNWANLTPYETIQTATIIPARAMGMADQTGSLEVGKEADIAILDKNPLENISNIRTVSAVLTNGNYYDCDALWQEAGFKPRKK